MSSLSNVSLPKPKDWQDFERKTRELFAYVLSDPNTQMHGRSGQAQHGVDIWGHRDQLQEKCVGVQCKKSGGDITDAELEAELAKAKGFRPAISEFILVTTAPRDAKIQAKARELTKSLARTDQPIMVAVWGWEDIEENAALHAEAWEAFDPTYDPFTERAFRELNVKLEAIDRRLEAQDTKTKTTRTSASAIETAKTDEGTARHGKITAYQALIDNGDVKVALAQLEGLKAAEWQFASRTERFRLLVAIAAATLRLGDQTRAGSLLLDAYAECPEHPKAALNRAKGFLLANDAMRAGECAHAILEGDPTNADAASVLVQSRVDASDCADPLTGISPELRETPDVLIARIHFLRCKEKDEWVDLARESAKAHPKNALLKQFAAEALLDKLIDTNPAAIAGAPIADDLREHLHEAVETLYELARKAIDKGYGLLPSTAHNATIALRFIDDEKRAKQVLDAALVEHPGDDNLKLQRAIVAFSEGDYKSAIALLSSDPIRPEAAVILAESLVATSDATEALAVVEKIESKGLPEHVSRGITAVRATAYRKLGESERAIAVVREHVDKTPDDVALRALYVRITRLVSGNVEAEKALDVALGIVTKDTVLTPRLELAFEAAQLDRQADIVDLLNGRVATDRPNEALDTLLAGAINGGFRKTTKEILSSLSEPLRQKPSYLRAEAILAINTGDPSADGLIGRYLQQRPDDLEMILSRAGIWQRDKRDGDIRRMAKALQPSAVRGRPELRMRLAALITRYDNPKRGLELGYATLLSNWDDLRAHLLYHGLFLLDEYVSNAIPATDRVVEDCVVAVAPESGQLKRYRIEAEKYPLFADERIPPTHELAKRLAGRKPGDKIIPYEGVGAQALEIKWIKHVWIDALHRSMDEFNERFPNSREFLKLSFDADADDPFRDMREITKGRAQADQNALNIYEQKTLPLAFVASLIGRDPLEAWSGLIQLDRDFKVCVGIASEREGAKRGLAGRDRKGCILDAITLSVIRRLNVAGAVTSVCGPIYTTQSVIDLLAYREAEAIGTRGKKQGFVSWRDEKLVFEEHSTAMLDRLADERSAEYQWARENCRIAAAMPRRELSTAERKLASLFDKYAIDPAIAAQGNDLLLLSEDMGYRIWAHGTLGVEVSWLQPVLIIARTEGSLSADEYSEAVISLALSRHNYTTLDAAAFVYDTKKGGNALTPELKMLLAKLGGPSADLRANTSVAADFIDQLNAVDMERLAVLQITSAIFDSVTAGRKDRQGDIVRSLTGKLKNHKSMMHQHAFGWLVGHSIGTPAFEELIALRKLG